MAKACDRCRLVHTSRVTCVDAHKSTILLLLTEIGVPGRCRLCGSAVFWVRHRTGKTIQYTPYGQNHNGDCPEA